MKQTTTKKNFFSPAPKNSPYMHTIFRFFFDFTQTIVELQERTIKFHYKSFHMISNQEKII